MNIFKKQPLFVYDEGNDEYRAEINGIVFVCENYQIQYDKVASALAKAYEHKLDLMIQFMLPDIVAMFDINDIEKIKLLLGKPYIDVERSILTYLENQFDHIHIIDIEFVGIFDEFLYCSIDG